MGTSNSDGALPEGLSFLWQSNCTVPPCKKNTVSHILSYSFIKYFSQYFTVNWYWTSLEINKVFLIVVVLNIRMTRWKLRHYWLFWIRSSKMTRVSFSLLVLLDFFWHYAFFFSTECAYLHQDKDSTDHSHYSIILQLGTHINRLLLITH